jgi:bifunctional non-homologous end joining protein LigD
MPGLMVGAFDRNQGPPWVPHLSPRLLATRLAQALGPALGLETKSWAVPKGPSMNPADKRLAIQVEDHSLAYGRFAGTIPEGRYGAGEVLIWDSGTYEAATDMEAGLREGLLKFTLAGDRLHGVFSLVRFKRGVTGKEWLLMKD